MFTVALHPSALADPLAGARAVLDAMKMRHVDALGGVLMAYDDEALCGARRRERDDDGDDDGDDETSTSESDDAEADDDDGRGGFGRVLHASGHVDVRVRARCEVFTPVKESRLVGTVNKIAHDFIGALVLDRFNVAIAAENIREELVSSSDDGCWRSAWDATHVIKVGSQIVFTVKAVTESDDVVLLRGAMKDPATGEREYVARSSSGITSIERKLVAPSDSDSRREKKSKKEKEKKEKKEKMEKKEKRERDESSGGDQSGSEEKAEKKKKVDDADDGEDSDSGFKVHAKKSADELKPGKVSTGNYEDVTLNCRDCSGEFVFTVGEQEFYATKGWTNQPTRCEPCKKAKKERFGEDVPKC